MALLILLSTQERHEKDTNTNVLRGFCVSLGVSFCCINGNKEIKSRSAGRRRAKGARAHHSKMTRTCRSEAVDCMNDNCRASTVSQK